MPVFKVTLIRCVYLKYNLDQQHILVLMAHKVQNEGSLHSALHWCTTPLHVSADHIIDSTPHLLLIYLTCSDVVFVFAYAIKCSIGVAQMITSYVPPPFTDDSHPAIN